MFGTFDSLLLKARQKLQKANNILESRTIISLCVVFTTCFTIFLLAGLLYFRNEVIINEAGTVIDTFTAFETAEDILKEREIELGEFDYYVFERLKDNVYSLEIIRSVNVNVIADGLEFTVEARADATVESILSRCNIKTDDTDVINPGLSEICKDNDNIIVTRTFSVEIIADGELKTAKLKHDDILTVQELLELNEISISSSDLITPSPDSIVTNDTEIVVRRVEYTTRSVINELPYNTKSIESNLTKIGETSLISEGVHGKEEVIYSEKLIDGVTVSSTVLSVNVVSEPIDEIISIGKALAEPYSKRSFEEIELINGLPANYEYIISGKACAYTAGPRAGTASGRKLEIGTVAVNPNVIPYGSLLYIVTQDGRTVYGEAVAADTGAFIEYTDVVVDLYMGLTSENYQNALDWGARYVDVYVISVGQY